MLDLGCGGGAGVITEHAKEVYSVDLFAESIDFTRKRCNKNINFKTINSGGKLPFPDGDFDIVLSFQLIEHVEGDAGYLSEAERVLKKDGILIVVTPDRKTDYFLVKSLGIVGT